jgi:hypothetical protein
MRFFLERSGAFLCLFLLAQESDALLLCVHGYNHKQTQNHKKEKNIHAPRIAWTRFTVLYRGFANAKQLCKSQNEDILWGLQCILINCVNKPIQWSNSPALNPITKYASLFDLETVRHYDAGCSAETVSTLFHYHSFREKIE